MPEKVGRFAIRRCLGEGAFGRVYEAHDPQLDRDVALKVAKLDRGDTDQRVKRFLREAKSAANLRHPGIVPLFEFGQEGAEFFIASAYIRGCTLKEEISSRKARQEIDLTWAMNAIRSLAEALGYAHGQGIVHRDVKPANVLLDEKGVPMLTDFGLATRQDEAEQLTHQGQILGTPLYMAPEQARGHEGGALPASDQYALGVMLYEAITGRPPFEGSPELVMFNHQETDPVSPRKRNPLVSRDLETICLKMLEKDPERRYPDCLAVAEDLRRCRQGEPIEARRIGRVERVGRWAARNPLSAVLMAAVAVLLVVGTVVSLWFAVLAQDQANLARKQEGIARQNEAIAKKNADEARVQTNLAKRNERLAREQAERARRESEKATRVSQFLSGLFDASDPVGMTGYAFGPDPNQGSKVTARDVLLRGVAKIRTELKDQPETRASVLVTVGSVLRMLGQYEEAQPLLEEALEIRRKLPGVGPGDLAEAWFHVGWLHHMRGDHPKALQAYRESHRLTEAAPDLVELQTRSEFNIAWVLTERGEIAEAEALFRKVLKDRRERLGPDHMEVAVAQAGLASVLLHSEKKAIEALGLITPALETFRKNHGNSSLANAMGLAQQAIVAAVLGRTAAADEKMRKVVEINRKHLGDNHPFVAWSLGIHAHLMEKTQNPREAIRLYEESLEACRKGMGLDHPMVLRVVNLLAQLKAKHQNLSSARLLFEEMHQAVCRGKGDHHFLAVQVALEYGYFLRANRLRGDAETWFRKVLDSDRRHPEFFAPEACAARNQIGLLHFSRNPSLAAQWFQQAIQDYDRVAGPKSERYPSRTILMRNRIDALANARLVADLLRTIEEFERMPQGDSKEDREDRAFVAGIRRRLPAMTAEESVRIAACLGLQAPTGAVDWSAPTGFLDRALLDQPLFEMKDLPRLENFFDQEGEITTAAPIDPKTGRPQKIFLVPLEKGRTYQFDLMSTEIDPILSLTSKEGKLLARNDDGGLKLDSRIRWTCPVGGEYTLIADTYGAKRHGRFRLMCSLVHAERALVLAHRNPTILRHDGRLTTADHFDVPGTRTRTRTFLWDVDEKKPYHLNLKGTAPGWTLQVEEPESQKLLTRVSTPAHAVQARFVPTRTGPVRITVIARHPGAGGFQLSGTMPLLGNEIFWAGNITTSTDPLGKLLAVGRRRLIVNETFRLEEEPLFHQKGTITPAAPVDPVRKTPYQFFTVKLEKGLGYRIDMKSTDFDAYLRVMDASGKVLGQDDDSGGNRNARLIFVPPASGNFRIQATQFATRYGKFTLDVRQNKSLPQPSAFTAKDSWQAEDPWDELKVKKRAQTFLVNLEANQSYQIDLQSFDFDAYLRLEEESGKVIAVNDDGGGGLNSRIRFRPLRTGSYRIVATTLEENETGDFLLKVLQLVPPTPR